MNQAIQSNIRTDDRLGAFLVVFSLVVTLVMNGLASWLPLGGKTTGELSDLYPTLFTPAGYVFSIWALIYSGLIAYAIYQAQSAQQNNERLARTRWIFILSCVFNSLWIVVWHYQFIGLSLVIMLGILGTLIWLYEGLEIGRSKVTVAETFLVRVPMSIYLGWITVATVANTSVFLYNINWNGFGINSAVWAAITIGAAAVINLLVLQNRRDVTFGLVAVWAFVGIYAEHGEITLIAVVSLTAATVVALFIIVKLLSKFRGQSAALA